MVEVVEVLGIEVAAARLHRWADWLAPARQPFLVASDDRRWTSDDIELPFELLDTYELYGKKSRHLTWLTAQEFGELPRERRADLVRTQVRHGRSAVPTVRKWESLIGGQVRTQADGHRFVWWPDLLAPYITPVLSEFVENGRRPSQHRQVTASTWKRAERRLPQARELGGTFADSSGPNCFGAVMGAAGRELAASEWMQREPFESWLAECTVAGGADDLPGTVLVWRSPTGGAEHAAVTLGDGWALHKPSQGWMSPTKVLTVPDVVSSSRCWGRRLTRRRLVA